MLQGSGIAVVVFRSEQREGIGGLGAGWESLEEYIGKYGEPERWTPDVCPERWISKLQIKQNGFFVYWKKHRECEDGSLNKVKIITYE